LQVAREAMHTRVAWVVNSTDELLRALHDYLGYATTETAAVTPLIHRGAADADSSFRTLLAGTAGEAMTRALIAHRDSEKMALLWSQGGEIPWRELYARSRRRTLRLPTYPFRRESLARGQHETAAAATRVVPPGFDPARDEMERFVVEFLAAELGVKQDTIDLTRRFRDYGADSLTARRLLRAVAERFHVVIAGRQLADASSIRALLESLPPMQEIAAEEPDRPASERAEGASFADFQSAVMRRFREGAIDYAEMDKLIEQGSLV
jgi:acyl transferase domain-containing protein